MQDLSGRTAVITGGASGIGYAMAESFAGAGMKLALADKDADLLDQAVATLTRSGAEAIGIKLDVTDRAAMIAAAAAVQAAFGAVHVLCNNAGIGAAVLLEDTTPAEWDASIGINLTAIYNGLHAFLPAIRGTARAATSSTLPRCRAWSPRRGWPPIPPPSSPWWG